ncbi:MAG: VanZ family protein [Candidatus Arcticimaribacter sp.]
MPKFTWSIFTISVAAIIVFLSTVPLKLPPIDHIGLSIDKVLHSIAYFVLATCLGLALDFDWKIKNNHGIIFIAVFLFGFTLEIIQGYALVYRSFERYDLLANTFGILACILSVKTIKKIVVKSRIFIN